MTTWTRQRTTPRWVLLFLAAIVAVLAIVGLAATAPSASAAGAAGTRVGGSDVPVTVAVGPPARIAAGQRLGEAPDRVVVVVATGVAANGVSKFGSLTHAADGIAPYSTQRLITAGHAGEIQAHHLIEKRFADVMGGNTKDWASVVVTRSEHQVFTNEWRQAIPYGSRNVTPAMVNNAARNIYRDYPEILQALGLG